MKKAVAIILCLIFALSLVGCDAKSDKELIVGYWQGNEATDDNGIPLGSNMVVYFGENGTGTRYTIDSYYGKLEIPFAYSLSGGIITIDMSTGSVAELRYQIKDNKLYLTDPQMNTTEEYLRIDSLPEKYKQSETL